MDDIVEELCKVIGVTVEGEREEFGLFFGHWSLMVVIKWNWFGVGGKSKSSIPSEHLE